MAFHVRDPETDRIVRQLAAATGASLTEAIRNACEAQLRAASASADKERRLAEVRRIQARIASYPETGLKADKAFFDSLNDE